MTTTAATLATCFHFGEAFTDARLYSLRVVDWRERGEDFIQPV